MWLRGHAAVCSFGRAAGGVQPGVRPAERPAGRPDGRRGGARVVGGAEKKKAFDRGGPVRPPRSNAADDHLRGWSGGALFPQPKTGRSGRQRPPAKILKKIAKKIRTNL